MAGRKQSPDLHVALNDPEFARRYIKEFDWGVPDPPKYICYGIDDRIWFASMTDEQAVLAAFIILKDVDIQNAWRSAQYEKWIQ